MAALRLQLLGGFEARLTSGKPLTFARKKTQALLAYLAVHPDQLQPRDKLAALFWGDVSDDRARHSLRQALFGLRRSLPPAASACLVEHGDAVGLSGAHADVDVVVFERLAAEATPDALDRAAALYRGPLLEGVGFTGTGFEEWLLAERERLRELALETLARLLALHDRAGDARAVQTAFRLLSLDPTQEAVHRTLMRLYARQGRRGAALRQYQACVNALERELSATPEAETRALYRQLLLAAPSAPSDVRAATPVEPASPEPTRVDAPVAATPLVGRVAELAGLRQAWQAASAEPGRAALILGEAGIGKSRVVEALAAEAAAAGGRVLVGRAHENEQILPFGPWIDALRHVVASTANAMGDPWRAELARLFPDLGPSTAQRPPTGEEYVRLFEAIARVVQTLADARPLLIALEDLQWADETSLRLLVSLARRIRQRRVLIVGTVRSEEIADAPALRRTMSQLGQQPDHLSLTLPPLSEDEIGSLVRSMASARSDEATIRGLAGRIWRFSQGNAFMAIETFRALRDDPLTTEGAPPLPSRVRELVAARLDRLTERGRRLAMVASVIGGRFEFPLLERAAGLGATAAAEGVDELVARHILHVVGEQLDFTHERVCEVAYASLLPPQRKAWHAAVAAALEGLHAEEAAAPALALGRHHFASDAWDRAWPWLARAGTAAAARFAHHEAIACLEQALSALDRLPQTPAIREHATDLRFAVRHSCVPLGDHRRILEHLAAAEAAAQTAGDRMRLGWALVYRAHGLFLAGESRAALEPGAHARAIASDTDDPALEESANFYLGQVHHWLGSMREAAALFGTNIRSTERTLAVRGIESRHAVTSRVFLAWCLAELGGFADAHRIAEEAIRTAEKRDNAYELVYAYSGAALVDLRQGNVERATAAAQRAVDLCQGRDFPALWAMPASILGLAWTAAARVDAAIPMLERAVEVAAVLGAPILGFLAEAYLVSGRVDDARAVATRALALAVERGERGWEAWARRILGEIAVHGAGPAARDAEAWYRGALAIAQELGLRPLEAHCHLGLARTNAAHLATASALYRDMNMPSWRERADAT